MLTEDDLRELIDSAASLAPAASPLPPDLFHVETAARPRRRFDHNKLAPVLGVAAALIVVVGGIAWVSSLGGQSTNKSSAATAAAPAANSIGGGPATTVGTQTFNIEGAAGGTGGAGTPSGGNTAPLAPGEQPFAGVTPAAPAAIVDSAKVIKNGALEVRVGKGAVTESVNRLTALASGLGGYVSDTRTTTSDGSQASAMISVRVPAAAFEQLMGDASKLGDVRSTTTSGQDATAQFTDIDAQLTALTSTRDQFLLVLGEAKNVNDILQVQDRITQVQIQIDQLEGQKRLLDNQTSFGTLSVTFLEPGATAAAPPADDNKDLGDAWRSARNSFVDGIEWIVSVTGTLALLALCCAVLGTGGWFIYRYVRRRALTL